MSGQPHVIHQLLDPHPCRPMCTCCMSRAAEPGPEQTSWRSGWSHCEMWISVQRTLVPILGMCSCRWRWHRWLERYCGGHDPSMSGIYGVSRLALIGGCGRCGVRVHQGWQVDPSCRSKRSYDTAGMTYEVRQITLTGRAYRGSVSAVMSGGGGSGNVRKWEWETRVRPTNRGVVALNRWSIKVEWASCAAHVTTRRGKVLDVKPHRVSVTLSRRLR